MHRSGASPHPRISLLLVAALAATAPFAMELTPAGAGETLTVFSIRGGLILFGPVVSAWCAGIFVRSLSRDRFLEIALPRLAAALAAFSIGWRCFPYWAAGVYQMDLGAVPVRDLDPKGLFPTEWIGVLWTMITFAGSGLILVSIPLLIVWVFIAIRNQHLISSVYTGTFFAGAVAFLFLFQRNYTTWLLD